MSADLQRTPAPDPMADFQAKVIDRLRNDIAGLLPEEVLQKLIEQAVQDSFFKERKRPQQYGNPIVEPSWFVEAVTKAGEPMLRAAVERFMVDRKDVIEQAIAAVLTTERLQIMVAESLAYTFKSTFDDFLSMLRSKSY